MGSQKQGTMKAKTLKILFYVNVSVLILSVTGIIVNVVIGNTKLIVPFIFLVGLSVVQLLRWREGKNEDTNTQVPKK